MSSTTQNMSYSNGTLTTTSPPNIAVMGPGMQYWIVNNGGGAQYACLNMPPVSLAPGDAQTKIDVGFVDAANHTIQLSAMNPPLTSQTDGRVYIQGTSSVLSQTITVKAQIMGRQADQTGYYVVSVTNNGGSSLSLKSVVLSLQGAHFCQSRTYDLSASTGDSYSYDGTNKQLNITNSGIANVTIGIASNFGGFSTTQHYKVVDSSYDPLAEVVSNGNLADTATATATSTKYVYLAIGDSSNQITIGSGATSQFVFIFATATTLSAMNTLISNAKSTYASDITTFNSIATSTRMSQSSSNPYLDFQVDYLLMKATYMAKMYVSIPGGYKFSSAGSYTFFEDFARDGYHSSLALSQTGNAATISDDFAFHIAQQNGNFSQQHKLSQRLSTTTGYTMVKGNNGSPGDQDMFVILKGYEYYIRTLDNTWLTNNITNINNIAAFLKNWYDNDSRGKSSDGAFCGGGSATYPDGEGNVTGQSYIVDPVMSSILIHALRAVVELNTAAGNSSTATTYNTWRNTLIGVMSLLWNASGNWPIFNKTADGTSTYNNRHLPKVDVLIFDALQDTTKQQAMISLLVTSTLWDDTNKCFYILPTTDSLYSNGDYWYGSSWHIMDYKAFSSIFRYGTATQVRWAWSKLKQHINRVLNNNIMTPGERNINSGLFGFSSGAFTEMITRGLWGIDAHASNFTIKPNIYKLGDSGNWTLKNYVMGGSTWNITHTGVGPIASVTLDGSPVSGNINYPSSGTHTISITSSGRSPRN